MLRHRLRVGRGFYLEKNPLDALLLASLRSVVYAFISIDA